MAHLPRKKAQLMARVRRIAGQMAAIEKAIEQEADCSLVLQQVAGARGALNGLMGELIEDHVREHVARPGLDAVARAAGAEELIAVVRRYAK
ncbi:metal/formaldehyde-sensitive transcriptional repressor [Reyranella sp.]|jgi:DNA-binding FrmR family transcriptional regulator|uniref:metal/formaldehyde-sensitive transcriptional repressor n=1 Tax=Reyranella sp. TaxID=1929291 RepID=UPI002725F3B2|nr:metal/formaldehyde-sensitive transcriptional repressor [Reyranella sp.]MDO8977375.1 metal/formaldehyde-sensitive transcriptional repressor [Reyranella sp.]MDP3243430.1 metal/formaldehyde-sensitive transcriptional repressor [Reyranella sp.]